MPHFIGPSESEEVSSSLLYFASATEEMPAKAREDFILRSTRENWQAAHAAEKWTRQSGKPHKWTVCDLRFGKLYVAFSENSLLNVVTL